MNQQHFPGGGLVPPFLPHGGMPPHARLIGYPIQPGVVVPTGASNSVAASSLKEEKNEEERVGTVVLQLNEMLRQ